MPDRPPTSVSLNIVPVGIVTIPSGFISVTTRGPEAAGKILARLPETMVEELTQEAEIGRLYVSKVKRITDFGAFCEIFPGTDGLVHISELCDRFVERIPANAGTSDDHFFHFVSLLRTRNVRGCDSEAEDQGGRPG